MSKSDAEKDKEWWRQLGQNALISKAANIDHRQDNINARLHEIRILAFGVITGLVTIGQVPFLGGMIGVLLVIGVMFVYDFYLYLDLEARLDE